MLPIALEHIELDKFPQLVIALYQYYEYYQLPVIILDNTEQDVYFYYYITSLTTRKKVEFMYE